MIYSPLTVFLATASTYDLLGDYNQTAALLAVVMAYFTTNFVEQNDEGAKLRNLGYAGGILGLMFLTKQTIFLASTIVHFIILATLCWKEKDRNFWKYCRSVIVGFLIPVTITFLILALNRALIPFFGQVFLNVDGKGSLLSIIFGFFWIGYKSFKILSIALGFIVFGYSVKTSTSLNKSKRSFQRFATTFLFVSIILAFYRKEIQGLAIVLMGSKLTLLVLVVAIVPAIVWCLLPLRKKQLIRFDSFTIQNGSLLIFISVMLMWSAFYQNISFDLYEETSLFNLISSTFYPFIFAFLIIMGLFYLLEVKELNKGKIFLACACVGSVYSTAMAAGGGAVAYHGFFFTLPLFLCICFDYM